MNNNIERAKSLRKKMEQASAWTNDADALEMIELFPMWVVEKSYIIGERIQYNELLYKCVQAHISQAGWMPDITPALWVRVFVEEWPEWIQPQGSADAYMLGDKVTFEGKHYISLIDGNVWSPAVYPQGWEEFIGIEEEIKTETEEEQIQDKDKTEDEQYQLWIQPIGSSDAYNVGDRVIFENKIYESLINGNIWSPTAYSQGWNLIN